MSKSLQAIRGMNDILPEQTPLWRYFEGKVSRLLDNYGYKQIRMPIVEFTELFKRSIGEVTDIVEKEMYTFEDRNGDSLTLRPEGTAACVRAVLEHGITGGGQVQKLWYIGPMFRHERPQKGRYRQFHQIGVEVFNLDGPDIDAELIVLTWRLWGELGIQSVELGDKLVALEREAFAIAGEEFNLSSPKQLGVILYEKLGLPIISKTAKGQPSTAEAVLSGICLSMWRRLAARNDGP